MKNITDKTRTLRTAVAQAVVKLSRKETVDAVLANKVPKGNVIEASRIAGLFAVKQTSNVIPDCHPLPVEYCEVRHEIDGLKIRIEVEVHAIYRTGVEVEAMHGASVSALTIYDMLKPIDNGIEITDLKLLKKTGGKSHLNRNYGKEILAAVIVCSDRVSSGKTQDTAGKLLASRLKTFDVEVQELCVISDDVEMIQQKILYYSDNKYDLVMLTGGTGLSLRDVTPEAVRPLLEKEIPGIAEAARNFGQERIPYSMLSRSMAGIRGKTLILALPGSEKGAIESFDALFPYLFHAIDIINGSSH